MLERSAVAIASFLLCAADALGGTQLFEGSWSVKAFGNERTNGTSASAIYSAFRLPLGVQCNPLQPRCPFQSTPTDGAGNFAPLGGSQMQALFCAPWADWQGLGTTARPAKGQTPTTGGKLKRPIPPLYRNPAFFTTGGAPNVTECTATSTGATPGGKGLLQAGMPLTGKALATTTGTGMGGFQFPAAAAQGAQGIRGTRVGEFNALYPYVYSYTYATLRNDVGVFGPGNGPGSFSLPYQVNGKTVARVTVKQGAAKFGGTMKMLGAVTSKVCYYRAGGCSLSEPNWYYDAIGAAAYTREGVVTKGYQVFPPGYCLDCIPVNCYRSPWCCGCGSYMLGSRFPWTTGCATVTAVGRGPHKTVHYAKGYDNRTPASGMGTIQLVSPTLTHWLQPAVRFETGGIAILRLQFAPEPRAGLTLAAGISLLAAAYRLRRSRRRDSATPHEAKTREHH